MSTATLNIEKAADFWRVARRLHSIYAELDANYELGMPPCPELEGDADRPDPEVMDRVRQWFDQMDARIQVWQLRQLLQSTSLQNEENLRYLVVRHLERPQRTEADKDKLDFLLVQYFAHCAPHGLTEQQVTLAQVAQVLQPVLGPPPAQYPDWAAGLDEKLQRLNNCNSLEDLQNSGALLEVRELKLAIGDQYFSPGLLIAFTRFNFRARRAFFKAMHLDLHAIREAVNQLEQRGYTSIDCREAGLTENESLDQVRHVVHQWKTPFRAPYSGGSSFLQLILLRLILQRTLEEARAAAASQIAADGPTDVEHRSVEQVVMPAAPQHVPVQEPVQPTSPAITAKESAAPKPVEHASPATRIAKNAVPDARENAFRPSDPLHSPVAERVEQAFRPAVEPKNNPASAAEVKRAGADPLLMQVGEQVASPPSTPVAIKSAPPAIAKEAAPEHDDYLERCVVDISEQLSSMPPRNTPSVSAITLGGCKLLIATWEADAFINSGTDLARALQRTVAARTILHVCMERHRKSEPTDVAVALDLARAQVSEMETQVISAKESNNIDAAVNLAATTKRLLALIDEAQKVSA